MAWRLGTLSSASHLFARVYGERQVSQGGVIEQRGVKFDEVGQVGKSDRLVTSEHIFDGDRSGLIAGRQRG